MREHQIPGHSRGGVAWTRTYVTLGDQWPTCSNSLPSPLPTECIHTCTDTCRRFNILHTPWLPSMEHCPPAPAAVEMVATVETVAEVCVPTTSKPSPDVAVVAVVITVLVSLGMGAVTFSPSAEDGFEAPAAGRLRKELTCAISSGVSWGEAAIPLPGLPAEPCWRREFAAKS